MSIKLDGLKGMQDAIKEYPKTLQKELRKTLVVYGNKMVRYAQKNHRFKRKSGSLERSISKEVSADRVGLMFFIKDDMVKPENSKKGNSYGVFMHEGTYQGYKQSKSARRFASSQSKSGKGWEHDHFMDRAWDKYIKTMQRELKRDMVQTAQKLRLK